MVLFVNNLAEMFTIIRECVVRKAKVRSSKVMVTLSQRSKVGSIFRVWSITSTMDLEITLQKCLLS